MRWVNHLEIQSLFWVNVMIFTPDKMYSKKGEIRCSTIIYRAQRNWKFCFLHPELWFEPHWWFYVHNSDDLLITVAMQSKAWLYGHSLPGILSSNPAGEMDVCLLWVLSSRGLCFRLITRPEESYWLWCVWVWSWILDNEEALAHWGCCATVKRNHDLCRS
jgi:hypothetical protein